MSFPKNVVLWLHLAFVIFTIGPVTLAIMSTPRYIRQRDVRIVRFLTRMTLIFAVGTVGVLVLGVALASMMSIAGKWWIIVSATLYVVALLLLALVMRDQHKAIKALDEAASTVAAPAQVSAGTAADHQAAVTDKPADTEVAPGEDVAASEGSAEVIAHVATVERGRIAMMGGVVSLIWLVILVLMVWR